MVRIILIEKNGTVKGSKINNFNKENLYKKCKLKTDENFISKINLEYNGQNKYYEWKEIAAFSKRADFVGQLSSNLTDANGESFIAMKLLIREFMGMDEEFLEENEREKKRSSG